MYDFGKSDRNSGEPNDVRYFCAVSLTLGPHDRVGDYYGEGN